MEAVEDDEAVQCDNAECNVAEDGKCVEGIGDPTTCTHYGRSVVVVHRPKTPPPPPEPAGVRLSSAEALSLSEAQALIRKFPSNVIGIVGPRDAGKTSLIAGVFDLFQQGTVAGFAFAGSSTLYAFERACHNTRRESGNEHADMQRTEKGSATFLHLDLADTASLEKRTVLFANRAGEDYTDAQSDTRLSAGFHELRRSDTLTMLVDGQRLLNLAVRHEVRSDILLTLRAIVEGGATRPTQRVAVVLTKIDAIRAAEAAARSRAMTFFTSIVRDVEEQFHGEFLEIQRFEVAASPQGGETKRGEGTDLLLQYWMKRPGRNIPPPAPAAAHVASRVFGQLTPANSEADNG